MKKRGLSSIIATLIIILITLVAVAIIWVAVSAFISNQSSNIESQNNFFSQNVGFVKVQLDPTDGLKINTSIKTSSGSFKAETGKVTASPAQIDVLSVADLSGSMRTCTGTSTKCCNNILGGYTSGGSCYGFNSTGVSKCTSACGGSLTEDGLTPAQNANTQLISTILQNPANNNRVGLSSFNETVISYFSSNLTNNSSTLNSIVSSWRSWGGTCTCCGINDARSKLANSPNTTLKTIILMSDGEANVQCSQQGTGDAKKDSIKAACSAYSSISNLTIYTVSLGANADVSTMSAIAKQCGPGQNFSAYNVGDLITLYQSLANQIVQTSTSYSKLNYLKIIFYDSQGNSTIVNVDVPGPLQTLNYNFNLDGTGLVAPIVKMEIYPVITDSQGKEVVGPLFDSWEKQ